MKINLRSYSSFTEENTDACVLLLGEDFQENKASSEVLFLDRLSKKHALISTIITDEKFAGRKGQSCSVTLAAAHKSLRVIILGIGKSNAPSIAEIQGIAAKISRLTLASQMKNVALVVPDIFLKQENVIQALTEGVLLGTYRFDKYLTGERRKTSAIEEVSLLVTDELVKIGQVQIERGTSIASAISLARDLVNEPPTSLNPVAMATVAENIAKSHNVSIKIFARSECEKMGMGMFLGVARASKEAEPRFVHLTYRPKKPALKKIALIGKSITFDSGGLSLKTSQGMEEMKSDMAGGAAVLGVFSLLDKWGCPYEVHGILPCTENMLSDTSYKLGDVLVSMSGKTVEINNTDAEGRLILGDAFTYAIKEVQPDEMIDLATLTGACMVGLGRYTAGIMGTSQELSQKMLDAAKQAGEELWPLPLPERLFDQLRSEVADMRNSGDRLGGALIAGLFLKEFTGTIPWVHLDIAGPSFADKEWGIHTKGGTGYGVALLAQYLLPHS